jgi:hypothetical protein
MFADWFFGSAAGGWEYPRTNDLRIWPLLLWLVLVPCVVALTRLSRRYLARHEAAVLGLWMAAGLAAQVAIHGLYPYSLGRLVASPKSNGFYEVALRHGPRELLRDFQALAPSLPLHAKANLAGKVLLFHLLAALTDSPQALAYLILALSNLGGLLAYAVARDWFGDAVSGLYALVLYLFLPCKLFIFPLLNTVTPVLILLSLWLLLRYLAGRRRGWLVLLGLSLYGLVLFEPLPLAMGVVFLAVLARHWGRGDVGRGDVLAILLVVPGAFFAADLLMWLLFRYEIVAAFLFALRDAREFNALQGRPYAFWVAQNLADFLFNAGAVSSAVFLALAGAALLRLAFLWRRGGGAAAAVFAGRPETLLVLSLLAVLLLLDLLGINRGETVRLWIFLAAFLQLSVAHFCATRARPRAFEAVVAVTLLQVCITISMVGFTNPD